MLEFHENGLSLLPSIGRRADIYGLKSDRYASGSVLRKVVLAECAAGRWGSPWHEMTVKDLHRLSVDEAHHLSSVNENMAVDELSYLCSGRTDWGLCRPSISAGPAAVTKNPKKRGDPKQRQAIFASESFAAYVRKCNEENLTTGVPINLVAGYTQNVESPALRRPKRRASDEL